MSSRTAGLNSTLRSVLTAALFAAAAPVVADPLAEARAWRERADGRIVAEYLEFLRLPNLAADREGLLRTAAAIQDRMARLGLAPTLLAGTSPDAVPAVFGEWRVPGARRTIVFYAHYDGQPAGNLGLWTMTRPFEPVLMLGANRLGLESQDSTTPIPEEARIYARSASDDKLGVWALLTAVEALRSSGALPDVNVKFFFEGEEEAGSPHLREILERHRELLASDGWVILDGPAHSSGPPQVVFGVRGDSNVSLKIYGPLRPLHSGHYGNWAPNPGMVLARLLASMQDDHGRVIIDGWYDDVVPPGERERRAIAEIPSNEATLRQELGIARPDGDGRPLLDLLLEPSLNINGMKSGDVGDQARNVIPTAAEAVLDLRLVKGNDFRRQFEKLVTHVRKQGFLVLDRDPTPEERRAHPRIARLLQNPASYNASRTDMDLPLSRAVAAAVRRGAGQIVELPALGGSLPLVVFQEVLGAPTLTVSFANHDNNQHAENENLRIGNLRLGIDIAASLLLLPWD